MFACFVLRGIYFWPCCNSGWCQFKFVGARDLHEARGCLLSSSLEMTVRPQQAAQVAWHPLWEIRRCPNRTRD
ncbi:hypothetical protein V1507DRAFT_465855 [Lipomyces tetrasporus]